jgi:hypothetical protein
MHQLLGSLTKNAVLGFKINRCTHTEASFDIDYARGKNANVRVLLLIDVLV